MAETHFIPDRPLGGMCGPLLPAPSRGQCRTHQGYGGGGGGLVEHVLRRGYSPFSSSPQSSQSSVRPWVCGAAVGASRRLPLLFLGTGPALFFDKDMPCICFLSERTGGPCHVGHTRDAGWGGGEPGGRPEGTSPIPLDVHRPGMH